MPLSSVETLVPRRRGGRGRVAARRAPLVGQTPDARRLKIGERRLPGIDLGLGPRRTLDAIGGRRARLPDGLAGLQRLPGRVLVKFRPDASADARAAALASVRTARAAAAPWGDFEVARASSRRSIRKPPPRRSRRAPTSSTRRPTTSPCPTSGRTIRSTPISGTCRRCSSNRPGTSTPARPASIIVAVLDTGVAFDNAIFEFDAPGVPLSGQDAIRRSAR